MKADAIPYAGILRFTIRVPSDISYYQKDMIIPYRTTEEGLYLEPDVSSGYKFTALVNVPVKGSNASAGQKFASVLVDILDADADVLDQLKKYESRSLLRVDCVIEKKNIVQMALLTYTAKRVLEKPLLIVVDEAVSGDLRRKNLTTEEAVGKFTNWFLYKTKKEAICFTVGNENMQLFSRNNSLTIKPSRMSGALHVVNLRDRRNFPEGLIQMLCGEIIFTDQKAVRDEIARQGNDVYQALIKDNNELLKLWSAYNDCEKELAKKKASEMGVLRYSKWTEEDDKLVFYTKGRLVDSDFVEDMYYEAVSEADYVEDIYEHSIPGAVTVGSNPDRSCINTARFVITPDENDFGIYKKLPSSGVLFPSLRGSSVQTDRRTRAQELIRAGRCQLPQLKVLLQSGYVIGDSSKHRAPVTDRLEKQMFGKGSGLHFNDRQKAAIDAAINTPDMAIIQGPPGTGKTQVIKSIIERISELEKGKARILISSTQHDAVDNAVNGVSYNGVPVNRAVARKRESSSVSPIYEYIDRMIDKCSRWLEQNETKKKDYSPLFTALHTLRSNCTPEAVDYLGRLMKEESFSAQSFIALDALSRELSERGSGLTDDLEALRRHLDDQSLTPDAFLLEGKEKLRQLIGFMRNELEKPELIPDYWRNLTRQTESSEEFLQQLDLFAQDLNRIRSEFGLDQKPEPKQELLDNLELAVRQEVAARIVKQEQDDPKPALVRSFMQELTGTTNVKTLIQTYSKINAATCQQAASRTISDTMKGFDDQYDYVIVDEAARSNPLDLMIPMVMGKKIILVGDQMQLPHMLEDDVVTRVLDDHNGDPAIKALLKESLFVRLFNSMKENDEKDSSAVRRVVMLNTQFRMHPMIADLVSRQFYEKEDGSDGLISGCTAESKRSYMPMYGDAALAWIDLLPENGYPHERKKGKSTRSRFRQCEIDELDRRLAKITGHITEAERILSEGKDEPYKYRIGIITFYKDQMIEIDSMINMNYPDLKDHIQVGTVDAFQGKEFDVVILSTVRSNNEKDIGFVDDLNRLCVAFSRAKRLLIVIGDSGTVTVSEPLKELFRICKEGGGYYECLRPERGTADRR